MSFSIGQPNYPKATQIGVDGPVYGHLEGGTFNRRFVADSIQPTQSGDAVAVFINIKRPELPPPIGPVSLAFSLNGLFNGVPTQPEREETGSTLKDQQAVFSGEFYEALAQTSLSDADKAKIQFGFFNPNVDVSNIKLSDGSPLQAVLQDLVAKAQAATALQGIDVSTLTPAVDGTAFNLNISDSFSKTFEDLVNASDLTPEQKAAIIFAHYNSSPPVPGVDPKILADFENAALQQIRGQFGLPDDFKPAINNSMYNNALKGGFEVNLQLAFNAVTRELTDEQIAAVKNAIQNMDDPSIPADIKALAQRILDKAISQTQLENKLPIGFQPTADQMREIFNSIASNPLTAAFVQTRELINATVNQIVNLMPESPEKALTLSILQAISEAILKAQNTIYEMQNASSETARNQTEARLGMLDQQIRERQEQSNALAEQTQKQQTMKEVMDVLGPIMKAFEVIMAIVTGGIFAAIFVVLDMHFNFMSKAIEGIVKGVSESINESIPDNGDPETKRLKEGLKALTQVVILSAMLAAGGTVLFQVLGSTVLTNIGMKMVTESEVIKNFSLMVGIAEKDVQWVVLAVTLAITIAIVVVSFINPSSAVQQTPAAATQLTVQVLDKADEAVKIVDSALDVAQSSVNMAQTAQGVLSRVDVVDDVVMQSQNVVQKILSEVSDTISNVLNQVMDQLKNTKAYQKLLDLLDSTSQFLQDHPKVTSRVMQAFSAVQTAVSGVNSGLQGGINITQARIAESKGKHEAAIEELEAMIKNLQKILNNILSGMSNFGDELNSLKGVLDNLYAGLEQTLTYNSVRIS